MFKLYRRLSFLILPFLVACTTGNEGNVNAPEVSSVYTAVTQFHPNYFPHDNGEGDYWLALFTSVSIKDRQSVYDMEEVKVLTPSRDYVDYMLGGPFEVSWTSCFDRGYQAFHCLLFEDISDSLSVKGWSVRVLDSQGLSDSANFSIKGFNGVKLPKNKTFVYSESFDGDVTEGIKALTPIDQAFNSVVFENRSIQEAFFLEFYDADPRAKYYKLSFFGGEDGDTPVGELAVESELLMQNPIDEQGGVSLLLPWSEVSYAYKPLVPDEVQEKYGAADVQAVNIILYDDYIAWREDIVAISVWHNYQSFSEYINLL